MKVGQEGYFISNDQYDLLLALGFDFSSWIPGAGGYYAPLDTDVSWFDQHDGIEVGYGIYMLSGQGHSLGGN